MPSENCKPPQKPTITIFESEKYGFPKGTEGRGNVEIQGILIHCVSSLSTFQDCRKVYGALGRPRGIEKDSVHYGIPYRGNVQQYVDDADIAWGLGPILPANETVPTYPNCIESLDWEVAEDNPGVPFDKYLIHIAVETSKNKAISQDKVEDCNCRSAFDPSLSTEQSRNLIQLVSFLVAEYEIPIEAGFINFFHSIDPCVRAECGCQPCIVPFLCAVDEYCQAPLHPEDVTYEETEQEATIEYLIGVDQFGEKRKFTKSDLLVLFDDSGIRVKNKTNWENILRNAPAGSRIIFDAGEYVRTQVNPIDLKVGQVIEGKGQRVTRILDSTGKSFLRFPGTVNIPIYANYRINSIGIEGLVAPDAGSAGLEDIAGATIWLTDVLIKGYDTCLVLDQTETFNARDCYFGDSPTNVLWIVNGPQRNPSASGGFTNDIHFTGCTFSGGNHLTDYLIRDDGGYQHSFRDCLFNGGKTQFFGAGLLGYVLSGNYFEGCTVRVIRLDYQTAMGDDGPGRCAGGMIDGNMISASGVVAPVIKLISGDGLAILGNAILGTSSGYVLDDNPDFSGVVALGNFCQMRTWNTSPQTRSLARNAGMAPPEPFLIGSGYPTVPEAATDEAVQQWYAGIKRKAILNNGTIS
jgi:hypothetical protein